MIWACNRFLSLFEWGFGGGVWSLKQMSVLSESFDLCRNNIRQGLTSHSARWISISRNKAKKYEITRKIAQKFEKDMQTRGRLLCCPVGKNSRTTGDFDRSSNGKCVAGMTIGHNSTRSVGQIKARWLFGQQVQGLVSTVTEIIMII